jgi:hypothetical protein
LDGSLDWGEAINFAAIFMPKSFRRLRMSGNLFLLFKKTEFQVPGNAKPPVRQIELIRRIRILTHKTGQFLFYKTFPATLS